MARVKVARGDTGKILCDMISVRGGGWQQDFTIPEIFTVTGAEVFDESQNSVTRHRFVTTMEFATRFQNATLDNKNEFLLLARRSHVFTITDLEGFETSCKLKEITEQGQIEELGHYPRYRIKATFAREGFSR